MFGEFIGRQGFVWLTSTLRSPRLDVGLTNEDEETRFSQNIKLLDDKNNDLLSPQSPWS